MPELAEVVNAAFAYANEPADLAALVGPPSASFRLPGPSGVLEYAQTLQLRKEANELLRRVAPTVGVPDPFKAAILAMVCGTLVEWGADPGELAGLILARLPHFLAQAESVADRADTETPEALFAANPDGFRAWQSLSLMLLPTMAVLTRGVEFRDAARANADLVRGIEAFRENNREANFVATVLGYTDGLELIVLHPDEGKGFRVRLEAVNTNFHLFTLLQGELIGGGHLPGPAVEPEVIAVATGEAPHEKVLADHARWQFYDWTVLVTDTRLARDSMKTWLWGEGKPEDIREFEGERVVILGPPLLGSRMWDSNFFANIHDALRSRARVTEELTPEDVQDRIARIRRTAT